MITAADARRKELEGMTQKEMLAQIRERAKLGNWYGYHTWNSQHSEKGWPDVVLLKGERMILAELQRQRGRLTREQEAVIHLLKVFARKNPGLEVYVVRPLSLEWFLSVVMA